MVLWEIANLVRPGRLELDLDDPEVVGASSMMHAWPMDLAVARSPIRPDFRGDPADELIAATSVVHGIPLAACDRTIRSSSVVPLAG